jgi:hypothetical protein
MKNIFSKSKKPHIYSIEINDTMINEQIGRLLIQLEKHLSDFRRIIEKDQLLEKDDEADDLLKSFLLLRETTSALMIDVEKIQNIELQEKKYLLLNDELFLEDKKKQLETIRANIDAVIAILKGRPSVKEYKQELLEIMLKKVSEIKAALQRLRDDDEKLNYIYASLSNL